MSKKKNFLNNWLNQIVFRHISLEWVATTVRSLYYFKLLSYCLNVSRPEETSNLHLCVASQKILRQDRKRIRRPPKRDSLTVNRCQNTPGSVLICQFLLRWKYRKTHTINLSLFVFVYCTNQPLSRC